MSLTCEHHEAELISGKLLPNCLFLLPGVGMLSATLRVMNIQAVTLPNGSVMKRVGCAFIPLNDKHSLLLQRCLSRMQMQNLAARH